MANLKIVEVPMIVVDGIILVDNSGFCVEPDVECSHLLTISAGLRFLETAPPTPLPAFVTIDDTSDPAEIRLNVTDANDCGKSYTLLLESYDISNEN